MSIEHTMRVSFSDLGIVLWYGIHNLTQTVLPPAFSMLLSPDVWEGLMFQG